jgi:uncharacterized coiled-coil protein SlyX
MLARTERTEREQYEELIALQQRLIASLNQRIAIFERTMAALKAQFDACRL